ncbi:MAG: hypothetical protein GF400_02450, partial [Candidatus Eisenbacteria bacterium]|nr:hypothetical protein [Candidatus Eisenbacteria bacterium]
MRHATIALLALGLVALLCGQAAAVRIDRDFHESFDVEEGFRLLLRSGDGDVTITPWEKDAIDVTVRYLADINRVGLGDSPDFEVEFEEG